MIHLDPCSLVARGLDRECYVHPENPDHCVKVTVSGDFSQATGERKYYERLLRRNVSWRMISRFHGVVSTNLGEGLVFDLIRDYDGSISKSLGWFLSKSSRTPATEQLVAYLSSLKIYLLAERIIVRDLKEDNILVQRLNATETKWVIIDGLGNNEFIPVSELSARLARRKIMRQWRRFERGLTRQFNGNENLQQALQSSAAGDQEIFPAS